MSSTCVSYEIYKQKVGGKTYSGENMKDFEDLPENIKKAWKAIDEKMYEEKNKVEEKEIKKTK